LPQFFNVTGGITVELLGGSDALTMKGAAAALQLVVPGSLNVDMGNGNDVLELDYVKVGGSCSLVDGNDTRGDTFSVKSCTFGSSLQIGVGNGDNSVTVESCQVMNQLKVYANGTGTNHFVLDEVQSVKDMIWVVMGAGNDTLDADYLYSKLPAVLDGQLGYDTLHLANYTGPKANLLGWESFK
jgi:hypothetical protein